jgi:hypothetical protein
MLFRRMHNFLVPVILGLTGIASFVLGSMPASADNVMKNPVKELELARKISAARMTGLRTSAGTDPDTVWIGHIATPGGGAPGVAGGYGPFHVGRGLNRIVGGRLGANSSYDGTWDFDHFQAGELSGGIPIDSLMGWWTVQGAFASVGPTNLDDWKRSWFGFDYGNQANHVGRQGRTFGVTGIWHADPGNVATDSVPGRNIQKPNWAPIAGSKSMWCGIRSPGDLTAKDATPGPTLNNPINAQLAEFQGNNSGRQTQSQRGAGTDHNFPGYGSQWDQLLYRDVVFTANASGNVTLTFKYETNMSTNKDLVHASQTGYFMFDPLKQTSTGTGSDGNFISSAVAGPAGSVCDSFMVYVGAPVEVVPGPAPLNADFFGSDGVGYDIFDQQRRWFDEVIKTQTSGGAPGGAATWKEVLSAAGVNGTTAAPLTATVVLSASQVNTFLDADGGTGNGGRMRLVFRVKTNRGSDDENQGSSGFNSGGAGAAIIDDVNVTGGGLPALNELHEGFEGSNGGVDNSIATAASAAWKSTGKPPGVWFHLHSVEAGGGLPYTDPCGALTAAVRFCNMGGAVMSPGNHDLGDKTGGVFTSNTQDQQKWIVSPTINLKSAGVGVYNDMGIDAEIAGRVVQVYHDQMVNVYDLFVTGNTFRYGYQWYPARQANGGLSWSEHRFPLGNFSSTVPAGCFRQADQPDAQQYPFTPPNHPDSLRCWFQSQSRCMSQNLTSSQCSPASGPRSGGYYDNLSVAFVTAPAPPALSFSIWDQLNSAFPVNSQNKLVTPYGTQFDTLAAKMKSGYNLSPNTGVLAGPTAREAIPADTALVGAPDGSGPTRCDLVFRILPGVGNYFTVGSRTSGVIQRPDYGVGGVVKTLASAADATNGALSPVNKFWGAYMADNGAFGTGGNGVTGPGHGGSWDPNRWNSARMDTVEVNHFLGSGFGNNGSTAALAPGQYMTAYHESDPKYTILGIAKGRCYIQNPAQKIDENNINCGTLGGGGTHYPPDYITGNPAVTGYNANEIAGQPGMTYEFTKILPDGQFTPGTHIQYFYRKSLVGGPIATFDMVPDTNFTFNDNADPHRWLSVNVLPDRWKDPAFSAGGTAMACMLVVDLCDGRGDELMWVSMADSIGLTDANKRGAHNGWRARPDQNILVNIGGDDTIARRDNGGQAGTMWDLYETVAGESNVSSGHPGSRGAEKNAQGSSLTVGRWSTEGPSGEMARNYREMFILAADIDRGLIGPIIDQTDADVAMITDFLNLPGGAAQPRALWAAGYNFGSDLNDEQPGLLVNIFRATLATTDYRAVSSNSNNVVDLLVQPAVGGTSVPQTYGVGSQCFLNNDVFNVETPSPSGQVGAYYENTGSAGPYVAAVYAPTVPLIRNYITMINGFTIGLFGGGFGTETDLLNVGIRKYFFDMLTHAFGGLTCQPTGTPVGVGDNPGSGGGTAYVNFMNLKSSNPMRSGEARIAFGLAKTDKVEVRVYDVTGRLVKMVANRTFAGGQEHQVTWDGTDEVGNKVKSGVYFYQLKTHTWTSQKKLAVLTN